MGCYKKWVCKCKPKSKLVHVKKKYLCYPVKKYKGYRGYRPAFGTVAGATGLAIDIGAVGGTTQLSGFSTVVSENTSNVGNGIRVDLTGRYLVGYAINFVAAVAVAGASVVLTVNGTPVESTRRSLATIAALQLITVDNQLLCLRAGDVVGVRIDSPTILAATISSASIGVGRIQSSATCPLGSTIML